MNMLEYECVCNNKICYFKKIKPCINKKRILSIIIPTYNEEKNISRLINSLAKNIIGLNYEIVVVDDDSKDNTPNIINKLAMSNRILALHRRGVKGIFSAIQDGIKLSNSQIIIIMDSDFSHPPKIINDLLKYIKNYDIVSASRFISRGGIEAPILRKYGTTILNKIVRFILDLKITDYTGGFHAIKKSKFNQLKFKYKSIWGEFDMELLYLARKNNFKIKEIPFTYKFRDEGHSKSENLLKYGLVYLTRAIQLRLS
jgi:dolichol-phosphate mannosyltransferase